MGRAARIALLVIAIVPLAAGAASAGPTGPAPAASTKATGPGRSAGFPAYHRAAVAGSGRVRSNVALRMSDGIVLRADITFPVGAKGPFPTAC